MVAELDISLSDEALLKAGGTISKGVAATIEKELNNSDFSAVQDKIYGKGRMDSAREEIKDTGDRAQDVLKKIKDLSTKVKAAFSEKFSTNSLEGYMKSLKEMTEDVNIEQLMMHVGLDEKEIAGIESKAKAAGIKVGDYLDATFDIDTKEALKNLKDLKGAATAAMSILEPFMTGAIGKELGLNIALTQTQKQFERATKFAADFETTVTDVSKTALDLALPFMSLEDKSGQAFAGVSKALGDYRDQTASIVKSTGLSTQEIDKMTLAFKEAGIGVDRLNSTGPTFRSMATDITGAESATLGASVALRLFAGAGIDSAVGAELIGFSARNLGLSMEDSERRIGLFSEVVGATGEPMSIVSGVIDKSARELKYFGDTTQGVAEIYTRFVGVLGEGRTGLAVDFVNSIVKGIGGMDEGLKAFIGMASGLGGGGAIGGMLGMEEKLASGDIEGVLNTVVEQIESITGGPMMGRKEAIDSGNEEQFFMQRKLFQDFMKVDSSEQATRMMEAIAGGQGVAGADLDAARGMAGVVSRGKDVQDSTIGTLERTRNMMAATRNLTLTRESSLALKDSSSNFLDASQNLFQLVDGLDNYLTRDTAAEYKPEMVSDVGKSVVKFETDFTQLSDRMVQRSGTEGDYMGAIADANKSQGFSSIAADALTSEKSMDAVVAAKEKETPDIEKMFNGIVTHVRETNQVPSFESPMMPEEITLVVNLDTSKETQRVKAMVQENQNRGAGWHNRTRSGR